MYINALQLYRYMKNLSTQSVTRVKTSSHGWRSRMLATTPRTGLQKSYWNKIIWRWFLSSIVHVITFQDGTKERKSSGAKCLLPRPHQLFHLKEIFHAFNTIWPTISPLAKPMVPLLIHCVRLHIHMCHIIVHIYFSIYSHGSIFKLYYCDTISHTKVQLWTLNEYQSSSSCVL